jgi:hypothetical protein
MAIVTKVNVRKSQPISTLPSEKPAGFKYAAVFHDKKVIALFDSEYWANKFCEAAEIGLEIMEVVD